MSMSEHYEHPEPVRVHLIRSDIPMGHVPEPAPRRRGVSIRTITLTQGSPVQQILPQAHHRCEAYVQAATNPITIGSSLADVTAGGNAVGTIPATNTAPFPLCTTDAVWATASSFPTSITVVQILEESR